MERTYATPLLDKLGIKHGARVAILGVDDPEFRAILAGRTDDVTDDQAAPDTDLVLLAAESTRELDVLPALRDRIRPNGAIWVVSRKGRAATLRYVEVVAAAKDAGLVDNKVVSFSGTHTALRLVIPLALRPR